MDGEIRARIRRYYRTVSRYIDREHLGAPGRRFWRRAARETVLPDVLELGCGTGRITRVLAGAGSRVVGLDVSPEMLERARARLADRAPVHLVRGDMRRLPVAGPFGLVVAAADPFAHLIEDADRARTLEEVARVLHPRGRFLGEMHWLTPGLLARARRPDGYRRSRSLEPGDDDLRVRETWRCERETRRCTARYEYLRHGRVVDRASFRARLWSLDELHERLGRAGLQPRSLWGSFRREPFDPAVSPRLIVEATLLESTSDACTHSPG